jgi:hypothetical protein
MATYQIGPVAVDYQRNGRLHVARAYVRTPEGGVWIVAQADEGALRYLTPRAIAQLPRHASPAQVGSIFSDIAKGVRKIAKSKVFRSVVSTAAIVVSHPAFSAVTAMIPGVGPGIAAAGQFAGQAAKLALSATGGSRKAQAKVARMHRDAARGKPAAVEAARAYQGVVRAHKAARKAGPSAQAAFEAALRKAAIAPDVPPVALRLPALTLQPSDDGSAYELPDEEQDEEPSFAVGYAPQTWPGQVGYAPETWGSQVGCW